MEMLDPIENYKRIREEYRKGDHVLRWVTILRYLMYYARLTKGKIALKIRIQLDTSGDSNFYIVYTNPEIYDFDDSIFTTFNEATSFCQEEYLKFLAGAKND